MGNAAGLSRLTISACWNRKAHTRVHFGAQQPLMLRTNRRQIVNLAQVAQVAPNAADGLDLRLLDGSVIEVPRRRAQQFKAACGL